MVQQRGLKKELKPIMSQKRLVYHQTNSYFQVLSNEAFTKHGMNPSIIIFDELHAQPNRELYDVLVEGTDRAREQQLIIIITTAGVYDKESIGFQIHDYAMQVQAGEIEDSTFLPIIYAIDEDEDPDDSEVWKKVNPALGEIFEFNKLEEHYQQSRHDPVRWNHFLRFTLNKWVGQVKRFIPMMHWDACGKKVYPHKLKGKPCFAGLDLGSTDDLTAFVLIFPPVDKKRKTYDIIPHFYVPEDTVVTRSKSEQEKIKKWIQQGYITATPGNVRDYSFIRKDIIEASKLYDIRELAFDRWGASEIVQDIQENIGIELVGHGQGFADMSAPTKELLVMVLGHKLAHGGHPVLRWNADNLSCRQDAAENYKPDKEKAKERIDGVVALIMALGRCLANPDIRSVYEDRGILFL
jgi:phage terminase large subunit-like protein